jgi:hypothetical protein
MPRPPAQVAPFVEALGADLAVSFLMTFGGTEIAWSNKPRHAAHVVMVGPERAAALATQAHRLPRRVPLANRWLAKMLDWQGVPANMIAGRLRLTDVTVRRYLKDGTVR